MTLKVLDLESHREILENSNNPFAAIILIQLNAMRSKKQSLEKRYHLKVSETKKLYEKFDSVSLRKLYNFIDFLIVLPENLEIEYNKNVINFDEENTMRPMNGIERLGFQRGMLEKAKEIAVSLINNGLSIEKICKLTGLNKEEIDAIEKTHGNSLKSK